MPTLTELHAAHPFWVWAALAAALLAIEVMTGSGWLLWAAASAGVVAGLALLAGLSLPLAILAFALLTMVSTLLARRYLPRTAITAEGLDINDNVDRLVGHHGQAVQAFEGRIGRVFIDGKEWAAELEDGEPPAAGGRVTVVSVSGARLKVRAD